MLKFGQSKPFNQFDYTLSGFQFSLILKSNLSRQYIRAVLLELKSGHKVPDVIITHAERINIHVVHVRVDISDILLLATASLDAGLQEQISACLKNFCDKGRK